MAEENSDSDHSSFNLLEQYYARFYENQVFSQSTDAWDNRSDKQSIEDEIVEDVIPQQNFKSVLITTDNADLGKYFPNRSILSRIVPLSINSDHLSTSEDVSQTNVLTGNVVEEQQELFKLKNSALIYQVRSSEPENDEDNTEVANQQRRIPPDAKKPRSSARVDNRSKGIKKENPAIHKRQKYKRVNTGCLICRRRKIKCDEAKPVCMRCQKSGWRCIQSNPEIHAASVVLEKVLPERQVQNTTSAPVPPMPVSLPSTQVQYMPVDLDSKTFNVPEVLEKDFKNPMRNPSRTDSTEFGIKSSDNTNRTDQQYSTEEQASNSVIVSVGCENSQRSASPYSCTSTQSEAAGPVRNNDRNPLPDERRVLLDFSALDRNHNNIERDSPNSSSFALSPPPEALEFAGADAHKVFTTPQVYPPQRIDELAANTADRKQVILLLRWHIKNINYRHYFLGSDPDHFFSTDLHFIAIKARSCALAFSILAFSALIYSSPFCSKHNEIYPSRAHDIWRDSIKWYTEAVVQLRQAIAYSIQTHTISADLLCAAMQLVVYERYTASRIKWGRHYNGARTLFKMLMTPEKVAATQENRMLLHWFASIESITVIMGLIPCSLTNNYWEASNKATIDWIQEQKRIAAENSNVPLTVDDECAREFLRASAFDGLVNNRIFEAYLFYYFSIIDQITIRLSSLIVKLATEKYSVKEVQNATDQIQQSIRDWLTQFQTHFNTKFQEYPENKVIDRTEVLGYRSDPEKSASQYCNTSPFGAVCYVCPQVANGIIFFYSIMGWVYSVKSSIAEANNVDDPKLIEEWRSCEKHHFDNIMRCLAGIELQAPNSYIEILISCNLYLLCAGIVSGSGDRKKIDWILEQSLLCSQLGAQLLDDKMLRKMALSWNIDADDLLYNFDPRYGKESGGEDANTSSQSNNGPDDAVQRQSDGSDDDQDFDRNMIEINAVFNIVKDRRRN